MVGLCSIPQCKKLFFLNDGVPRHQFPKDMTMKRKWMDVLGLEQIPVNAEICGAHFRNEDYVDPSDGGDFRLKPKAVPTQKIPTKAEMKTTKRQLVEVLDDEEEESIGHNYKHPKWNWKLLKKDATSGTRVNKITRFAAPTTNSLHTAPVRPVIKLDLVKVLSECGISGAPNKIRSSVSSKNIVKITNNGLTVKKILPPSSNDSHPGMNMSPIKSLDKVELFNNTFKPNVSIEKKPDMARKEHSYNSHGSATVTPHSVRPIVDVIIDDKCSKQFEWQTPDPSLFRSYRHGALTFEFLSDDEILYLTGFTRKTVLVILHTLTSVKTFEELKTVLSTRDQLLLILWKFRHNTDFMMLSIVFKLDMREVVNIFKLHNKKIHEVYNKICEKSQTTVAPIRRHFHANRCNKEMIITSTEVYVEQVFDPLSGPPNVPIASCKVLVSCDEDSKAIFISNVFDEDNSDQEVFAKSGILKTIKGPAAILRQDKAFLISESVRVEKIVDPSKPVKIKKMFTEKEVTDIEWIDGKRVIIEKFINRAKENKILTDVISSDLADILNAIVFNCFYMCNYNITCYE